MPCVTNVSLDGADDHFTLEGTSDRDDVPETDGAPETPKNPTFDGGKVEEDPSAPTGAAMQQSRKTPAGVGQQSPTKLSAAQAGFASQVPCGVGTSAVGVDTMGEETGFAIAGAVTLPDGSLTGANGAVGKV